MDLVILAASIGVLAGLLARREALGRAAARQSPEALAQAKRDLREGRSIRSWLLVVAVLMCGLLTMFFSAAIVDGIFHPVMWSVVAMTATVAVVFLRMLALRLLARRRPLRERRSVGSQT